MEPAPLAPPRLWVEAARGVRRRLDPETYGGAYLLGLRGLVVIAHGNSSRTAVTNAITLAARGVRGRVVERVAEQLRERVGTPSGERVAR